MPEQRFIVGLRVHATSYVQTTQRVLAWARQGASKYVCVANVHMAMEAHDDPRLQRMLNEADLVTPDGMPLVWALKMLGVKHATRVYGPDLTLHLCRAAAEHNIPIGLYGGTPQRLGAFVAFLESQYPGIRIVCRIAPPFRALTPEEDEAYTRQIVASGARILFVGIGCPKQERWMAEHRERIPAVLLGVGAAFDFHAGSIRQAPGWMQRMGLEWFFRLMMEPKRLWRRYARHNPRFVLHFARQLWTPQTADPQATRKAPAA